MEFIKVCNMLRGHQLATAKDLRREDSTCLCDEITLGTSILCVSNKDFRLPATIQAGYLSSVYVRLLHQSSMCLFRKEFRISQLVIQRLTD